MSVTEEDTSTVTKTPPTDEAQPKDGDDQVRGMAVSLAGGELSDPAILAVREIPKFRYGREELLKLREAPLSQRKPDFLDTNEVSPTIWDPSRWNFDRKKSDTPTENGTRPGELPDHRRRSGDPRERLRKENDGIVLSPQRRSFNSGCFVPVRETTRPNRPHSPLASKNEPAHIAGVREIQSGTKRIGSGRILRDAAYFDFDMTGGGGGGGGKFDPHPPDYFHISQRNSSNDNNNQDRRPFGRDFDKDKDRRSGGGRYGNERRRVDTREQEEPEWFSGGPLSQNDTIELRGFDESEKLGKKKMSPSQAKRARDWFKKKSEVASVTEEKEEINGGGGGGGDANGPLPPGGGRSTPTPVVEPTTTNNTTTATTGGGGGTAKETGEGGAGDAKEPDKNFNDNSFIFEDILKSDSIPGLPGLLANGVGGDGDNNGQSRFSKWFSMDPNGKNDGSRRSSVQDESIIKHLLKDLSETTNVTIPGDSDSYFAPISPAANTGGGNNMGTTGNNVAANSKGINIMEMLQRGGGGGKQNDNTSHAAKSQISGRIMNLVDLEAKMRQNSEPPQQLHNKHQQKSAEDMTAFNRLLAQVSGGHAVTANGPLTQKTQPMSLMEMLSHSQQQDEAQARMAQMMGPASPGTNSQQQHVPPNDMSSRLQQKQQVDMLTKLGLHIQQIRSSPLQDMGVQQSRELLNRPEAQAILQGLKIGDITPQHLYQQLANPALQPRHRDMLVTILKVQGSGGMGPSPRVLSPVAPHPLFQQQQQQQLRVSPLPPNALHQRIPSPRELQVHTQNILQRALIKKKLEEQQENFRKKQEMHHRGQSPIANNNNNISQPAKSVSSPTPLAFTPTSVLRKMTAEKDEGSKDVTKLVDGGKLGQGRALTGMRQQTQQQQQPQQPIGQWSFSMNMKQAGRPIVKANNFPQSQQDQFFNQQQQHQQQKLYNQLQQQQQRKGVGQQQQIHGGGGGAGGHLNHPQYPNANQQFSQLTQQQLRAQHQQHARPTNVQQQGQSSHHMQQQMGFGNQTGTASWQQFLNPGQSRGGQLGRGGLTDGDLSPTSNQLTRWFSSDLLERARVGELPSTAGLAQHALSLEEIERLTAPPVHN